MGRSSTRTCWATWSSPWRRPFGRRRRPEKDLDWALDRLVIHGILHLVGYDHEAPGSDAAAMEAKSDELMAAIGHSISEENL